MRRSSGSRRASRSEPKRAHTPLGKQFLWWLVYYKRRTVHEAGEIGVVAVMVVRAGIGDKSGWTEKGETPKIPRRLS
jgi:hypothetical protein